MDINNTWQIKQQTRIMADNKFNFFESYHRALSISPDDTYGRVVKAMAEYVFNGVEPNLTEAFDLMAWNLIKPVLEKGKELSQVRANAGRSGGLNGKGISRNVGNENARTKTKQKQINSKQKQINSGIGIGEGIGIGIGEEKELANARKKQTKSSLDLSFVSEDMKDIVTDWFEYKKERGEKLSQRGAKSFYNKLVRLSDGDPSKAQEICENAKSSNYAGIFPLKKDSSNGLTQGMILNGDRNNKIEQSKGW